MGPASRRLATRADPKAILSLKVDHADVGPGEGVVDEALEDVVELGGADGEAHLLADDLGRSGQTRGGLDQGALVCFSNISR